MQFSARQGVPVAQAAAFAVLSDPAWVRDRAAHHGIAAARTDDGANGDAGACWTLAFGPGALARRLDARVTGHAPPRRLALSGLIDGMAVELTVSLAADGAGRCQLHVAADLRPTTLSARLAMPALRLARARIDRRFAAEVAAIAADIADRAGRPATG